VCRATTGHSLPYRCHVYRCVGLCPPRSLYLSPDYRTWNTMSAAWRGSWSVETQPLHLRQRGAGFGNDVTSTLSPRALNTALHFSWAWKSILSVLK
jgi:hypothetical protein